MAKKISTTSQQLQETVIEEKIHNIVDEDMAGFSGAILMDRSLPDIRDGVKTCVRRILWTMYNLKLWNTSAERKLAKISGDCLGSLHPHSSDSISGALNILNETFMNNYPLCENTGNVGSMAVSGPDSAAADRYTSCKLSKFGETILEFIGKETCDFKPNFSGDLQEPIFLPSIMPSVLTQYNFGLGVGYMCTWYGGNVNEVLRANIHRIKNPNCRLNSILDIMPAPDFPTAGIIMDYENLKKAYETGSGKFILRGKTEIKDRSIFIQSLPHKVYINNFMREMDDLLENPLLGIEDVIDRSSVVDKGGLFKVDIEVKCKKGTDMKFLENYILKHTSLQTTCNVEMRAIVNNKPMLCPLLFTLDKIIEHQNTVLIKAYTYDLNRALARKEIVEGLLKVISSKSILDKVIALIRASKTREDAKVKLMKEFDLTENQSVAILQIKLQQLCSMDLVQLKEEEKQLTATIDECNKVIKDKEYRKQVLIKKLKEYEKEFDKPRLTEINKTDSGVIEIQTKELIPEGNKIIMLSKQGFIKSTSEKSFNSSEHWTSVLNLGLQDQIVTQMVVDNKDNLVAISSLGRALPIKVFKLKEAPMKQNPLSLSDRWDVMLPGETITYSLCQKPETDSTILFVSKHGQIKLMNFSSIPLTRQKWTEVMKLKDGDQIIFAGKCNPKTDSVCIVSKNGQILAIELKAVSVQGKTSGGIAGLKLKKDDEAISAFAFNSKEKAAMLVSTPNEAKWIQVNQIPSGNRATQGVKVSPEKSMNIIGAVKLALPANKTQYIQAINNNDQTSWLLLENIPQKKLDQKMVKMTTGNLKSITVLENIGNKKEEK